jgi:peptidoglycan-N-acetylglucosamine deacetylase
MIIKIISFVTLVSMLISTIMVYIIKIFIVDINIILFAILLFFVLELLLLYGIFERRAPIFGRVFWKGTKVHKFISLTFDDGPNEPYTSQILDVLSMFNVKATFFVIGENAKRFPDTLNREITDGHEIGNHTYNHEVLPLKSPRYIYKQLRITSDIIESITGLRTNLFRTPHGWRNPFTNSIAKREGYSIIAWTLGVWDTDRPGANVIVKRTLKGINNGCVLLLHDGRGIEHNADSSQLIEALPIIISELQSKGYEFLTISDMMKVKTA